ncbi:MAG: DUF3102 domain-containing protein [Rhizonema sp. PD37]|nr:DUF3102 domain-containing protein [Rhizonema sp. PD37]
MPTTNKEREMRIAQRRVEGFAQQFGEAHRNLACHAAFPLVLTPELLYQIWANFVPEAPWTAVAHVLLSRLCRQVGYEMYEMDISDRNLLLRELKKQFGQERFDELGELLLDYVAQRLTDDDADTQDLRKAQEWTALAYTKPGEVARELALALSERVKQDDIGEVLRLASLVETLADPLLEAGFEPLPIYASGMGSFVRGEQEMANAQFVKLGGQTHQLKVAGVGLYIPSTGLSSDTTVMPELSWEEVQKLADGLVFKVAGSHLSDIETAVLQGVIEGKTYNEIAEKLYLSPNYVNKDVGNPLWKNLSKALGEEVSKQNFRQALLRYKEKQTSSLMPTPADSTVLLHESPVESLEIPTLNFEYDLLEAQTRIVVQQRTNEIKTLMRRNSQDIIDIGQKLIEVKQHLGHGSFINWLKSEFNWSISAATKFMQVAEQFKFVNFTNLNITASVLYLIAAPSTPKQARVEVLERASLGENIGYTKANAIVSQHRKTISLEPDEPAKVIESTRYETTSSICTQEDLTEKEALHESPVESLEIPTLNFEYGLLEAQTRIVVQQRTNEIKTLMRRNSQDIIDIGQKLIEVKQHLGHGSFINWLKSEFNWSISAATKFMQVAEQFKFVNFTNLNITASVLYLIAAPSTPKQARVEVLERASLGENIGYTKANAIVSQHRKTISLEPDEPAKVIESTRYETTSAIQGYFILKSC